MKTFSFAQYIEENKNRINHILNKMRWDGSAQEMKKCVRDHIKTRRHNNLCASIGRGYSLYPVFKWERISDE